MANSATPPLVAGLGTLAAEYPALLCDVWGVIHDGVAAFPEAMAALRRYRAGGGRVILLTNAPRPKAAVASYLAGLGAPPDISDDLITSGDVARAMLAGRVGVRVHHVGPERDRPIYEGLPVELVAEPDAELISCTGLFDDTRETPDDYAASYLRWQARRLPMLCANPDTVVQRGDRLIWCAGALAERYAAMGGEATIVGKPYRAIYDLALGRFGRVGPVLALGDGVDTDVRGAVNAGLDVAFVTGGIHAPAFGRPENPNVPAVHAFLAKAGLGARALMVRLAWDR